MVTLVYASNETGPVCERVVAGAKDLVATKDTELPDHIPGTIVRWGSRWTGTAEREINTREAIILSRDKRASRKVLWQIILCPETWFKLGDINLPCVIRPRRHHAGARFYVCRTERQVLEARRHCGMGWYASELISKVREFRVFVLQGRVICISERFPAQKTDVAWNLAMGGRLINIKKDGWEAQSILASIKSMGLIGLDFGAVDVAVDKLERPVVFEINTAPGLRNPYTIHQIAKSFKWAGKNDPPKEAKGDSWKDLIHPALLKDY